MRPATRFLAAVRQSAPPRLLQPGAPTGLTGLYTHPSPRTSLLYLYSAILKKLEQFPEHSVYRQATEALSRKRLAVVEQTKPPGYDGWEQRVSHELPELLASLTEEQAAQLFTYGGRTFIKTRMWERPKDDSEIDWNGDPMWEVPIGSKTDAQTQEMIKSYQKTLDIKASAHPVVEREPQWTVEQIENIEQQMGSGLIEEVIQVAEGELKLIDTLVEHKVWEDLVEKAPEGQWKYFERSE